MTQTVDIIIPVYKDIASTRRCLESVFASPIKIDHRLIVINDASPEAELSEYLEELRKTGKIILLRNKENLGFVKSVNLAMQYDPQHDVLLLNSDTMVANDWLDRLQRSAYQDSAIATVTPFSNNATICSYPKIGVENELPGGLALNELDGIFASCNKNEYLDIPTGVGFCLFIKRTCLNQVGYFDETRFPKGYGEENDFCLRASKQGFRNVIACDVFVYHQGSVSFGEAKKRLIKNSKKVLNQSYPDYRLQVRRFVANDPLRFYRQRVDVYRLQHSPHSTYLRIKLYYIKESLRLIKKKLYFCIVWVCSASFK